MRAAITDFFNILKQQRKILFKRLCLVSRQKEANQVEKVNAVGRVLSLGIKNFRSFDRSIDEILFGSGVD